MSTSSKTADAKSRGEQMRARLLKAAAKVFAERGYEGTRVSDINKAAKTSHGNFYWHFKNKDEILIEVLRPTVERMLELVRQSETPLDVSEAHYAEAVGKKRLIYKEHRHLVRVMREAAARGSNGTFLELWLDLRRQFIESTETWLMQLQAADRLLPGVDPVEAAEASTALTEQLSYTRIGLPDRAPSDEEVMHMGRQAGLLWYRGTIKPKE